MNLSDCLFGQPPELVIEQNGMAAPFLPVKKRTFFDSNFQHIFKAEGLSTELNFIAAVFFRSTTFVLDWEHLSVVMELHHVRLTAQAES